MDEGTKGVSPLALPQDKMMEKRLGLVEQLLEQSIGHAHMREAAQH